jgi:hypothetical protein
MSSDSSWPVVQLGVGCRDIVVPVLVVSLRPLVVVLVVLVVLVVVWAALILWIRLPYLTTAVLASLQLYVVSPMICFVFWGVYFA